MGTSRLHRETININGKSSCIIVITGGVWKGDEKLLVRWTRAVLAWRGLARVIVFFLGKTLLACVAAGRVIRSPSIVRL